MMRLIYQVLRGMEAVYSMGLTHNKLSPKWIERSQRGYKIIDDPLHDNEICENIKSRKKTLYMSPEAYEQARELIPFKPMTPLDAQKSDVFRLGLMILEAGLLKRMGGIYKNGSS